MTLPEQDRGPPKVRLFVPDDLGPGCTVALSAAQSHYLERVMRRTAGDRIGIFNGRDGEWLAVVGGSTRSVATVAVEKPLRPQVHEIGPWLAFAPVKKAATDFIVEKATELGASRLVPVVTRRTIVERVKTERLCAIARQAAEQCERLSVPEVADPVALDRFAKTWPPRRALLIADPRARGSAAVEVLADTAAAVEPEEESEAPGILIGPEGGFTPQELDLLAGLPRARIVRLGPRILRAETAALAALVCWQIAAGDWRTADPGSSETTPSGAR